MDAQHEAVEVLAGLATFMVMAYIIFVNPIVLGYIGVPGLEGKGLPVPDWL